LISKIKTFKEVERWCGSGEVRERDSWFFGLYSEHIIFLHFLNEPQRLSIPGKNIPQK
jgi:hypothetical protein